MQESIFKIIHILKYGNKDEVFKIRWGILKNNEDVSLDEYKNLMIAFAKYPKLANLHYLTLKKNLGHFFTLQQRKKLYLF